MVVDDRDREVWRLITEVPYVSMPIAGIALVINFVLPGFGTWIVACCSRESVSKT